MKAMPEPKAMPKRKAPPMPPGPKAMPKPKGKPSIHWDRSEPPSVKYPNVHRALLGRIEQEIGKKEGKTKLVLRGCANQPAPGKGCFQTEPHIQASA